MKFRSLAAGAIAGLLVAGGLVVATALPASATNTEQCVPSEAWTEVVPDIEHPAETTTVEHPAVYETVEVTPAVEYQPAVYETEYEFRHKLLVWKTKWSTNPNWNAEQNEHSLGWYATGNTRDGELISPEVPAQDAVTEERLVTEAWTETIVVKEAWTEITPDIEHPAATCDAPGPDALYLSHVEYCGGVDITLRNVSRWIYPTSVKIDGVHSYGPTVDNRTDGKLNGPRKDASKTRTITFPEDTGVHTVEYRIDAGTEDDLYKGTPLNEWVTLEIDTDCETNPEDTVEYGEWTDGEYDCDDTTATQTRTVTTTTWTLAEGEWTSDVAETTETRERDLTAEEIAALDCETEVPPVEEEPEPTPEPEPTVTPLPQGGSDDTNDDLQPVALAETGLALGPWPLTLGALAVALGAMAILFGVYSRRRQPQDIDTES